MIGTWKSTQPIASYPEVSPPLLQQKNLTNLTFCWAHLSYLGCHIKFLVVGDKIGIPQWDSLKGEISCGISGRYSIEIVQKGYFVVPTNDQRRSIFYSSWRDLRKKSEEDIATATASSKTSCRDNYRDKTIGKRPRISMESRIIILVVIQYM